MLEISANKIGKATDQLLGKYGDKAFDIPAAMKVTGCTESLFNRYDDLVTRLPIEADVPIGGWKETLMVKGTVGMLVLLLTGMAANTAGKRMGVTNQTPSFVGGSYAKDESKVLAARTKLGLEKSESYVLFGQKAFAETGHGKNDARGTVNDRVGKPIAMEVKVEKKEKVKTNA